MIRMIEAEDNKSGIYSMTGLKNKADVYNWYTMHYGQNKRHFEKWFDAARKSGAIKQFNTRLMPYKYYLYPDEILGVLEYDGTPFGSKENNYDESFTRSNRRCSNRMNEAYTRVVSDESGRMHYAIDSQFEAIRLILSEIKESLDWAEKYERKLHNDGSADETLYDVLFKNKKTLNKFNDALNDFYTDTID